MNIPEQKILELADAIIDEFGFLLDDYGVILPNKEKEESDQKEVMIDNIYGSDYYRLEDAILEHLKNYFKIQKEDLWLKNA